MSKDYNFIAADLFQHSFAQEFDELCTEVKNCTACKRMCGSQRVLNRSAGFLDAKIFFIGEAPGRLGADATGIPFHGDVAGHNFEKLLSHVGISRNEIFVSNAVLCNPKNEKGNNVPPNEKEILNCSSFLRRQIEIIDPKIVVTLGGTALKATSLIEKHNLQLKNHVRTINKWMGRNLIPVYHPGQRAMIHRSFANQLSDYQFIFEILCRIDKRKKKTEGAIKEDINFVIDLITKKRPTLSYFALHKLFYLAEYYAVKELGTRLTNAFIVRQKDGPYCTDLHYSKLKSTFSDMQFHKNKGHLSIIRRAQNLFEQKQTKNSNFNSVAQHIVEE
ncbi:MAG: uracil-DNA glycosylase, partial [Rhodospirillales bacterium]